MDRAAGRSATTREGDRGCGKRPGAKKKAAPRSSSAEMLLKWH
jgi:hypothetical protein